MTVQSDAMVRMLRVWPACPREIMSAYVNSLFGSEITDAEFREARVSVGLDPVDTSYEKHRRLLMYHMVENCCVFGFGWLMHDNETQMFISKMLQVIPPQYHQSIPQWFADCRNVVHPYQADIGRLMQLNNELESEMRNACLV